MLLTHRLCVRRIHLFCLRSFNFPAPTSRYLQKAFDVAVPTADVAAQMALPPLIQLFSTPICAYTEETPRRYGDPSLAGRNKRRGRRGGGILCFSFSYATIFRVWFAHATEAHANPLVTQESVTERWTSYCFCSLLLHISLVLCLISWFGSPQ